MDNLCPLCQRNVASRGALLQLEHHLNYGITYKGAQDFAERIGWPDQYTRTQAWIGQASQHSYCGYDFTEHLKLWMSSNGYAHLSVVELLHAEGSGEVGLSEMLLSHVQSEAYEETLWNWQHNFLFPDLIRTEHFLPGRPAFGAVAKMKELNLSDDEQRAWQNRPSPKAFVDYFCIRQCQSNDFTLPTVVGSIMTSMRTFVAFDVDTYLIRTFCLFELFQSIIQGCDIRFKICGSSEGKSLLMRSYLAGNGVPLVKAQDAQCRSQKAKDSIDEVIRKGIGFEFLNRRITQAIEDVLRETDEAAYQYILEDKWVSLWYGKALPEGNRLFRNIPFGPFQTFLQERTGSGSEKHRVDHLWHD